MIRILVGSGWLKYEKKVLISFWVVHRIIWKIGSQKMGRNKEQWWKWQYRIYPRRTLHRRQMPQFIPLILLTSDTGDKEKKKNQLLMSKNCSNLTFAVKPYCSPVGHHNLRKHPSQTRFSCNTKYATSSLLLNKYLLLLQLQPSPCSSLPSL